MKISLFWQSTFFTGQYNLFSAEIQYKLVADWFFLKQYESFVQNKLHQTKLNLRMYWHQCKYNFYYPCVCHHIKEKCFVKNLILLETMQILYCFKQKTKHYIIVFHNKTKNAILHCKYTTPVKLLCDTATTTKSEFLLVESSLSYAWLIYLYQAKPH